MFVNQYAERVLSQYGEDGILVKIFQLIGARHRYCVEVGGFDGLTASNTANLILNHGWAGCFIESDENLCNKIKQNYRDYPVSIVNARITSENLDILLNELGAPSDFDLLSIDIDGNDYWVWHGLQQFHPRVVVIEYNASYPPPKKWVMRYNENHAWNGTDYFGASLESLTILARDKGYELVGCEEHGANAFFVRKELLTKLDIEDTSTVTLYRPPKYGLPENGGGHPHQEGPYLDI